jgi:citrate/tricarballylate utilization protein
MVLMLALPRGQSLFSPPAVAGNFYAIMAHTTMATIFSVAALYVVVALVIGYRNFCRDIGEPLSEMANGAAGMEGLRDALSLKYLHGGGAGCRHPDDAFASARRVFHHFTFYGFLLCVASTVVAAIYHGIFGWPAPYGYASAPVLLGTAGGLGVTVGAIGLLALRRSRDVTLGHEAQLGLDESFIALLLLTVLTGLALLMLRQRPVMGPLLIVHLGSVLALFATLPYGKFVHGLYRLAALVLNAREDRT